MEKTIIFGLQEKREENYFETLDMVVKWLSKSVTVETVIENIDYVAKLESRRGEHQILIKLTSFSKNLEVLKNKRNLTSSKIRVDEGLPIEAKRIRKELVRHIKDAEKWGHKAFLKRMF